MQVYVAEHPLIQHKLTLLRDERTDSPTFGHLVDELVMLLAYEATTRMPVTAVTVQTPLAPADGFLIDPKPVVVPILRAGLAMLDGMQRLLPTALVGFLGIMRDEESLAITTYADRLPHDLAGRPVFVLDPMLATGGTMAAAIEHLLAKGAQDVTVISIIAAPEGLRRLEAELAEQPINVTLVTAHIDPGLDLRSYIVPGLGDAGDRLYGTI